ncbi:hypothetical protein GCM10009839_86390 [Catenulispora yoronensis]|uniref:Uncharacterized protein n=1 Tax=Catenulispora yoronensis TaxID=450799 RepID=A0ABN2VGW0_9ACTN
MAKETPADRIARILAASEDELDAEFEAAQRKSGTVNISTGGTVGIQAPGNVNGANVVIVNGRRVG